MLSGGKVATIRSASSTGPKTSIGSVKTLGNKNLKNKDGKSNQNDTETAKSEKQGAERNGTETSIDNKVKKLLKDVQKAREVDAKNPDPNAPINSKNDPSRFDNVNKLEGNSKEDAARNFGFSLPGTNNSARQNSQQAAGQAQQGSSNPIAGIGGGGGAGGGASGGSSGGGGRQPGTGPNPGGGISNPGTGGGGPITNPGSGDPGGGGTRTAAQIASDMTRSFSSLSNGANITVHSSDATSAQQFMAQAKASGAQPSFNAETNTISFSSKGLTEEAMQGILAASMNNPGSIKNFDVDIGKNENSGVAADIFKNMQELASLSGNNREINFDSTGDSFKIFDGDEDHGGLHDTELVAHVENNQQEAEEPVQTPEFNESENQAETQMA